MNIHALSDNAIARDIGDRLRSLRLRRNVTQKGLAQAANLSLNTLKALESGKGKLSTLIAVLRELDALSNLDDFIPKQRLSPLQLAKMQGKQRRRATGSRAKSTGDPASQ